MLFSRDLKIGVNFAFVVTPKSAINSSRPTKLYVFSTITISLEQINTAAIFQNPRKHRDCDFYLDKAVDPGVHEVGVDGWHAAVAAEPVVHQPCVVVT